MPSHFDCLGFSIHNDDEFNYLLLSCAKNGKQLPTPSGIYLQWYLGNGIQLWGQMDYESQFIGMKPHYKGYTTQVVGLSERISYTKTLMDGSFLAWLNPKIDKSEDTPEFTGSYPLIFDSPAFSRCNDLRLPAVARIQLAVFVEKLEIFEDFESYSSLKPAGFPLLEECFIPIGLSDEVENKLPLATAFLIGKLLCSEKITNKVTGNQFFLATVKTAGMAVDLLISPQLISRPLIPGQILVAGCYLSGMIKEIIKPIDSISDTVDLYREENLLECPIAGVFFHVEEDFIRPNLIGNRLLLKREWDNVHDPNAIAVYTTSEVKLGYIPKENNQRLAKEMDHGAQPLAEIIKVKSESYPPLSIRVYLPPILSSSS